MRQLRYLESICRNRTSVNESDQRQVLTLKYRVTTNADSKLGFASELGFQWADGFEETLLGENLTYEICGRQKDN
jgi:hypothetical protein